MCEEREGKVGGNTVCKGRKDSPKTTWDWSPYLLLSHEPIQGRLGGRTREPSIASIFLLSWCAILSPHPHLRLYAPEQIAILSMLSPWSVTPFPAFLVPRSPCVLPTQAGPPTGSTLKLPRNLEAAPQPRHSPRGVPLWHVSLPTGSESWGQGCLSFTVMSHM